MGLGVGPRHVRNLRKYCYEYMIIHTHLVYIHSTLLHNSYLPSGDNVPKPVGMCTQCSILILSTNDVDVITDDSC